jgi:hypothetical protein
MEPGGIFAEIYGVCPVPKVMKYDGVNGGRGAGRTCWTIMNRFPEKGPFICRNNRLSCVNCPFFIRVCSEEEIGSVEEALADLRDDSNPIHS